MSTTAVGRAAEAAACAYLADRGYRIIAKNWRTRWCEIDIVAVKDDVTYLVEAKYRANDAWGSGLEYITTRKRKQMYFAAQFWVATHKTANYSLGVVALTGKPPRVTHWLPDIS